MILSFKKLFGFGSKLMITGCITTIVNNIANLSIGKFYSTEKLGYYTRAHSFSEMTSSVLFDVIGTVSFPILSELQSNREQLLNLYKRTLFYTSLISFPMMVMMALLAKPIIAVLLTEKWLPCVFLMQILCLSRMFTPLSAINMNVLNALGRSDLYMKLDLSKIPLDIILLAITIPISVEAVVIANLVNSFICFFINAYLPGKLLGYGALMQLKDWRYIIISILIMIISVLCIRSICANYWAQLIIGFVVGILVYMSSILSFKVIRFHELLILLKIR